MMTKYQYTQEQIDENRRKWFGVLRDPESKKAVNKLESYTDKNARCCLGHACHALGIERKVMKFANGIIVYENKSDTLPFSVCNMLNIQNTGKFKKEVLVGDEPYWSLSRINDNTDLTPQEMADVIEDQFENDNLEEAYRAE